MTRPLMPKATAMWLLLNTKLTFDQIADFCQLHPLEVKGMADEEVSQGITELNPILHGQLEEREIERCENDPKAKLRISESAIKIALNEKSKKAKYTPVARRGDKPDAIAWLVKHYPNITDLQVVKLIGTTKKTIDAIRDKSHWNMQNIRGRDPVLLGLCSQTDLDKLTAKLQMSHSDQSKE
jgi:hypothetical protein